jgi:hypothetical protein
MAPPAGLWSKTCVARPFAKESIRKIWPFQLLVQFEVIQSVATRRVPSGPWGCAATAPKIKPCR